MSESMLACVRKGPGDLALERIPRPVLEALTDVILKTRLCTICGTDLHFEELPLPNIAMGHEVVGEIVETGDAVEGFQTGDRVVMSCMLACGQCASCQQGDPSACLHPMGRVKHGIFIHGCQAEYVRCLLPPSASEKYRKRWRTNRPFWPGTFFPRPWACWNAGT